MSTKELAIEGGVMFDEVTGELIDNFDFENGTVEQLPQYARAIRSIDKQIAHRKTAVSGCTCPGCMLAREIERLEYIREHHIAKLSKDQKEVTKLAENLLRESKQDSIKCPGIATFRFRKSTRLDTSAFDALTDKDKLALYNNIKTAFKAPAEFKVEPVAVVVKKLLKGEGEVTVGFRDAFKLDDRRTFKFEVEK